MSFRIVFLCMLSTTLMPFITSFRLQRFKRSAGIPTVCLDPPETGICRSKHKNYFYNPSTGECEQFTWGGCGGNRPGRFWTQQKCETVCKQSHQNTLTYLRNRRSPDVPKFCFDAPERGGCGEMFRSYFYNPVTGECEPFIWGGCRGNDNRFWTQHDCEVVCKSKPGDDDKASSHHAYDTLIKGKDVCDYPPETGRCKKIFPRFYFDGEQCDIFMWGGCGGNPNNFVTEESCLKRCMPRSLEKGDEDDMLSLQIFDTLTEGKDDCEYPPETGRCRTFFPRFYFDGTKCEFFVWGGCGGNPNNFETEEACMERCMP